MIDEAKRIQRSRLPKWAQQEIANLERNLAYHKAKLAEGPEDSDTFADPYGVVRPLGTGTSIVFGSVEHGRRIVARRWTDGGLYVMGDQSIAVRPQASNTCTIHLVER